VIHSVRLQQLNGFSIAEKLKNSLQSWTKMSAKPSMLMSPPLTGILICSFSTGACSDSFYIKTLNLPYQIRMTSSAKAATLRTRLLTSQISTGQELQGNYSSLDLMRSINRWCLTPPLFSKRLRKSLKRGKRNQVHRWTLWIKSTGKRKRSSKKWFQIIKCHLFEQWPGSFTRFSNKSMKKLLLTTISWNCWYLMMSKQKVHLCWYLLIDLT